MNWLVFCVGMYIGIVATVFMQAGLRARFRSRVDKRQREAARERAATAAAAAAEARIMEPYRRALFDPKVYLSSEPRRPNWETVMDAQQTAYNSVINRPLSEFPPEPESGPVS